MRGKWAIAICIVLSMALIPSALANAGQTFVVTPTGVDDTVNIQNALNEAAAHPGSVVELTAGDFYLSKAIVVSNFSGTLRGQGKNKTTVHNKPDVLFQVLQDDPAEALFGEPGPGPHMITFEYAPGVVAGLHVEHLGFDLVGAAEIWPLYDMQMDNMVPFSVIGMEFGTPSNVSTTWRDLRAKGDTSSEYLAGRNLFGALALYNLSGTHIITGCDVETTWGGTVDFQFMDGARLQVGGPRPEDRVVVKDNAMAAFHANTCSNCEVTISNVQASDVGFDVLWGWGLSNSKVYMRGVETYGASGAAIGPCGFQCAEQPSTYLFEHNTIRQAPGTTWAGFEIHEDTDVKSHIVIRDNQISGEGSFVWGPIFAVGARNAVISNNTISGSGPAAMYLGLVQWQGVPDDLLTTNLLVKHNDVRDWTIDSGPCEPEGCQGLPLAPIWLGAQTRHITVLGNGDPRTTVFDETDNPDTPRYDGANNLVGVNSQGAHLGQAIRDAMQGRIEAKKLFMNRRPY